MKTIDELDALHAVATAGEWVDYCFEDTSGTTHGAVKVNAGRKQVHVCETRFGRDGDPDCRFIAAAKNAWPEVSARLRAAEAEVERLRGEAEAFRACIRQREAAELAALADVDELRAECERLRGALREACSHLDMAVEASEESGDLDEIEAQEERDFIKGLRAALGEP